MINMFFFVIQSANLTNYTIEASIANKNCERYITFRGVILFFPYFQIFQKYKFYSMSADRMKKLRMNW
jgi:hypothetical protein